MWAPCDDCYDWHNFRINDYAVQEKINRLRGKYSNELLQIIQEMLHSDENFRPDPLILDQKLSKVGALLGKRILQKTHLLNLTTIFVNNASNAAVQQLQYISGEQQQQ